MENSAKKSRIWELDAFRGLFILCMVAVHAVFDLTVLFGADINPGWVYRIAKDYGSILFIVLSGICATLGSRSVKRGLTVLGFGFAISAVMAALTNFVSDDFGYIYFGILHLLGLCMILYPLFKRLPTAAICALAAVFIALGYVFRAMDPVDFTPLSVVGFTVKGANIADSFPIFPNVGFFLAGIAVGRTLYREKRSLLPEKIGENAVIRFFRLCGRYSLHIYVLHQPVVYGIIWLIYKIF